MPGNRYQMSFTSAGLLHRESVLLAELYLGIGDWEKVKDKALTENLLQARAQSTARRQIREVLSRLKHLSTEELVQLVHGPRQDQACLLWVSLCRRYRFIAEFAVEVLQEHRAALKNSLTPEDYEAFYNKKAEWHPELDEISDSTRNKLKQVLFRMLREANLLTKDGTMIPIHLAPALLGVIRGSDPHSLAYLPGSRSGNKGGQN